MFNTYISQTLPKNCEGGKIPKLILQGQPYPDTKTKQGSHKKRKLYANRPDEHTCKKSSTKY